jgi:hypothetical protein
MAADSPKTTIVLDLDAKEFLAKMREATGLVHELGDTESLSDLTTMFTRIGMVAGVAGAAVLALKVALDLTKEAEHIQQVNAGFEAMAASVGVSAETIREDLVKALGGVIDETDGLQAAAQAMALLGDNASRIPEIMDLARRTTKIFGGDALENFNSLSSALAVGNTRMLKHYGIVIDSDEALKKYAKSLGIGVEYLSDAGRKQAILNTALEQAKEKFKNVDIVTETATTSTQKFMVALKDLGEAAALAWDKTAGPAVRKTTSFMADFMSQTATGIKALLGDQKASDEYWEKYWTKMRDSAQNKIDALKRGEGIFTENMADWVARLKEAEQHLEKFKKISDETNQTKPAEAPKPTETKKGKGTDWDKLRRDHEKFEMDLTRLREERAAAELQFSQTEEDATRAFNERVILTTQENNLKREQIRKDFYIKGVISETEYQAAIDEINRTEAAKLADYNTQLQDARIKALENYANRAKTVSDGVAGAFALQGAKSQKDLNNFGRFGGVVFNSLQNNAVKAFKALGDGSQNAGEAMKGFMFNAIADIAEAEGQVMLAAGIGKMNPLEIAQGGALIALASLIRSQAGGKGEGGGVGAGGGGGGAASTTLAGADLGVTRPEPVTMEKKAVTLNIQGNYFDTDQSRTRIMEMIRESGDFTDFNINRIGP